MQEILNLHVVRERLTTDKIKQNNLNQVRDSRLTFVFFHAK